MNFRCDTFVFFCEVHRSPYMSPELDSSGIFDTCCDHLFHKEPIFTYSGTCYTTNAKIVENFPSIYNSVKVWLNPSYAYTPELEMMLLGSDATERHGIVWAISHMDHPAIVMAGEPQRAAHGTVTTVGLEISQVD